MKAKVILSDALHLVILPLLGLLGSKNLGPGGKGAGFEGCNPRGHRQDDDREDYQPEPGFLLWFRHNMSP